MITYKIMITYTHYSDEPIKFFKDKIVSFFKSSKIIANKHVEGIKENN